MSHYMYPWQEERRANTLYIFRKITDRSSEQSPYLATIFYITYSGVWEWEVTVGSSNSICGSAPSLKAAKRIVDVILEEHRWREVKESVSVLK